jgi:hypothetical protein
VSGKFETPLKEITPKIQFSGFVPKISRGEPAIQGTCFTDVFPLYGGSQETGRERPQCQLTARGGELRVICVLANS